MNLSKYFKSIFLVVVLFSFFSVVPSVLASERTFSVTAPSGYGGSSRGISGTEEITPAIFYPGSTMNVWGTMETYGPPLDPSVTTAVSMTAKVNGVTKNVIGNTTLYIPNTNGNIPTGVDGFNTFTVPMTPGNYVVHFVAQGFPGIYDIYDFPYTVTSDIITVNVKATPSVISPGGTSVIQWNSAGATACTDGNGHTGTSGSFTTPTLNTSTYYTFTCTAPGSTSVTKTVQVTVISLTVWADPQNVPASGDKSLIKWTSSGADSCVLSGGEITGSGTSNTVGVLTKPITSSTLFTVQCQQNAQTVPASCFGDYYPTVCTGTVGGSTCPDNEGDDCGIFNAQTSCPGVTNPWCFHGCSKAVSNSQESCQSFTTQTTCNAQSPCFWNAGSMLPVISISKSTTVGVSAGPEVNAFFQNNLTSIDLPYQNELKAIVKWGTPGMDNTYSCNVFRGQTLQTQTYFDGPFIVDLVPKQAEDLNPLSPVGFYTVKCQKTNNTGLEYSSNEIDANIQSLPDLTVGNSTPTTATVNVPVTLSAVVTNQGSASTVIGFKNFFQVSDTDPTNPSALLKKSRNSLFSYLTLKVFASGTIIDLPWTSMSALASDDNEATTKSYTFTSTGTYYVRACADKSNRSDAGVIDEGTLNEGNNCGLWTAIVVSSATPLPDLTAFASTPTTASAGSVTLNAVIKNQGDDSTRDPFWNFFQYSTVNPLIAYNNKKTNLISSFLFKKALATGETLFDLPRVQMSALGAGLQGVTEQSHTFSDGIYWVRACADKSNRNTTASTDDIDESNEENNCGPWVTLVVGNVPIDGLCATPETHFNCAIGETTNQIEGPTSWTWTCNGINGGNSVSCSELKLVMTGDLVPNVSSCIISKGDSSCEIKFSWVVTNPESTPTAVVKVPFTVVGLGHVNNGLFSVKYDTETFYLYNNAKLLDTETVTSSCEAGSEWNDYVCFAEGLPGFPDLIAGTISPGVVPINDSFKFSVAITNQGDTTTGGSFYNLFQVSANAQGTNPSDISPALTTPELVSGTRTVLSTDYSFSAIGIKYVRACADKKDMGDSGEIDEGDIAHEDNNCGPWTPITGVDGSIDGECSVAHFGCDAGSYNGGGGNNGIDWTWTCYGSGVGAKDASCTEPYFPGECLNPLYTNYPACDTCVNGEAYPTCTGTGGQCSNPLYTNYPACDTCVNGQTFPTCKKKPWWMEL